MVFVFTPKGTVIDLPVDSTPIDFALLKGYGVENNRARTLVGFQQRLEIAILTYNLGYLVNLNN